MINDLKNVYRKNQGNTIVLTEIHDAITYGYNRSKYSGPIDTYLTVEWNYNGNKIVINNYKNIILSFPNKNFRFISFLRRDDFTNLGSSVEIFNELGNLVCRPNLPALKIYNKYPKMKYKPLISFSWYKNSKIEEIKKYSNIDIDINTDIEVVFWFPNYREECCLFTEKGEFSKIYYSVDEERYFEPSLNNGVWY